MKYFYIIFICILIGCSQNKPVTSWNETIEKKCEANLKQVMNDPESYQNISWEHYKIPYESYYLFTNKCRAKNSFGALIIAEPVDFLVDSLSNKIYIVENTPSQTIADWMWKDWIDGAIKKYKSF